jgi:hypothetical protein
MPKYVRKDGTVHDKPGTLDMCGVRRDTQRLCDDDVRAIIEEHFARKSGGDVPIDVRLVGRTYGVYGEPLTNEFAVEVKFGEDPHPIPF